MQTVDIDSNVQGGSDLNYKEALAYLKKLNADGYFDPRRFDVKTPISKCGNILFNGNSQRLIGSFGKYEVHVSSFCFKDEKNLYEWIECEFNDLNVGDVAYRDEEDCFDFNEPHKACVILENNSYAFVDENVDIVCDCDIFDSWFKLVKKVE